MVVVSLCREVLQSSCINRRNPGRTFTKLFLLSCPALLVILVHYGESNLWIIFIMGLPSNLITLVGWARNVRQRSN